jgi:glyoxylase-like metal-dependent hydrolase (beta-lactamase superfamily II)/ferredoxin
MADPTLRLQTNVAGELFVDGTCIDCDTCRQLAPRTFADVRGMSAVQVQPRDAAELAAALQALVACPVGAIGDLARRPVRAALEAFPMPIDGPVSYLGFNARESFGADSYLLEHPEGNWMIDAPRWNAGLARAIAARGGLRYIFLTHRDDVADAARYAAHFGAARIIHDADRRAMPDAEIFIEGDEPRRFGDVTIVPSPGHSRGSCVLHYGTYLFSGDHVAWDREAGALRAHRTYSYDYALQLRSVERLTAYAFTWLLPGHGDRVRLDVEQMRSALHRLAGNEGRPSKRPAT